MLDCIGDSRCSAWSFSGETCKLKNGIVGQNFDSQYTAGKSGISLID